MTRNASKLSVTLCLATALAMLKPAEALAHATAKGFVLLLPTTAVIWSGAAIVAATALVLLYWPQKPAMVDVLKPIQNTRMFPQWVSLLVLATLLAIGFWGPSDPLANLLPLTIWTLWWVILVGLQAVLGNIWNRVSPFRASKEQQHNPPGQIEWLGLVIFAAFAWWQLVWVTPEDPRQLAGLILVYAAATLFASKQCPNWINAVDPFHRFFGWIAALSPNTALPPLSSAGMALVICILGTLSFDGLANSFFWAKLIGINPLDFQGRSTVMWQNSLGLFGFMTVLAAVIFSVVGLSWQLGDRQTPFKNLASAFCLSLLPIALGLHLAHFFTDVLVNAQYFLLALNNPTGQGGLIPALNAYHPTASFLNTAKGTWSIYGAQCLLVIGGHVVAVAMAHAALLRLAPDPQNRLRMEIPLALFAIGYTVFSLWILSAPTY
jgi:hypothetical protein